MNILVFLEASSTGLKRSSYEAITAALSVKGASVTGVAVNATQDNINAAAAYGLTTCLNVSGGDFTSFANGKVAAAIASAAAHTNSTVVLISANATGKDLAPRVAVKLQAGLLADCVELVDDFDTVVAKRPVYAGKAIIKVKASTPNVVATLRPNVFTARKVDGASVVTIEAYTPTIAADIRTSVVTGVVKNEGTMDVAEADIIVSGGRGLKGPENFHLVESLARSLGAAVGASRAVVDAGWRPHREQVGQTGKTVAPSMYIACGISGAVQHLAGMSTSKVIVAINKDKEAPIFKVADYGIVGDIFEVLPKLTSRISAVTGKQ